MNLFLCWNGLTRCQWLPHPWYLVMGEARETTHISNMAAIGESSTVFMMLAQRRESVETFVKVQSGVSRDKSERNMKDGPQNPGGYPAFLFSSSTPAQALGGLNVEQ